jgi:hypothetical protein
VETGTFTIKVVVVVVVSCTKQFNGWRCIRGTGDVTVGDPSGYAVGGRCKNYGKYMGIGIGAYNVASIGIAVCVVLIGTARNAGINADGDGPYPCAPFIVGASTSHDKGVVAIAIDVIETQERQTASKAGVVGVNVAGTAALVCRSV